jgi:ATP-dependent Clp protease, protease subunit
MKNITISGVIGWDATSGQLRESLREANGEDVEITISSPGGFVSDGLEMFNLIRNYAGNTTARLSGYAMSMASYIPLAANRIVAEDNAVYMIHNVRGGVFGDHNDILNYGATTKGMSKLIAKAYAKRTGKSMEEVGKMMDVETYLFGDEMVDHGFIDEIITTDVEKDPETARALACVALQDCNGRMSADITAVKQDLAAASRLLTAMGTEPIKPEKKEPPMADTTALSIEVNAAAIEAAKQAGITEERQRIAECRAIPALGHQALVDSMIEEGKAASEIAMAIVSAENSLRVAAAAALIAEAPPVVPVVEAPEGASSISRKAFAALSPREQSDFAKSGGRITD